MEKVLLQPANSLLQTAKKSKDLKKVPLLLQDLDYTGSLDVEIFNILFDDNESVKSQIIVI